MSFGLRLDHTSGGYLGRPCKFETCPDWVPVMDTGQHFARIALKTMGQHGFDYKATWAAKVRNVSRLGSQIPNSRPDSDRRRSLAGCWRNNSLARLVRLRMSIA